MQTSSDNNWDRTQKCGLIGRSTGQPCQQPVVKGRNRCRLHGGKTLTGIAHPNYQGKGKGKPYSDGMDAALAVIYGEVLADPELLSLDKEIALARSRLKQLVDLANSGVSKKAFADARAAYKRAMSARRRKDNAGWMESIQEIGTALFGEDNQFNIWSDMIDMFKVLDKLIGREHKRRVDMHAMMTTDQVVAVVARMMGIVRENVTDTRALMGIQSQLNEYIAGNPALASGMTQIRNKRARSVIEVDEEEAIDAEIVEDDDERSDQS